MMEEECCPTCQAISHFLYGDARLCRDCYLMQHGSFDNLTATERLILRQQDRIADLETIISVTAQLKQRVDERNAFLRQLALAEEV